MTSAIAIQHPSPEKMTVILWNKWHFGEAEWDSLGRERPVQISLNEWRVTEQNCKELRAVVLDAAHVGRSYKFGWMSLIASAARTYSQLTLANGLPVQALASLVELGLRGEEDERAVHRRLVRRRGQQAHARDGAEQTEQLFDLLDAHMQRQALDE